MGADARVVHWIEHRAEPQVFSHRLKHQQAAVKDNLECPVVEARKGKGHDMKLFGLFTPSLDFIAPSLIGLN